MKKVNVLDLMTIEAETGEVRFKWDKKNPVEYNQLCELSRCILDSLPREKTLVILGGEEYNIIYNNIIETNKKLPYENWLTDIDKVIDDELIFSIENMVKDYNNFVVIGKFDENSLNKLEETIEDKDKSTIVYANIPNKPYAEEDFKEYHSKLNKYKDRDIRLLIQTFYYKIDGSSNKDVVIPKMILNRTGIISDYTTLIYDKSFTDLAYELVSSMSKDKLRNLHLKECNSAKDCCIDGRFATEEIIFLIKDTDEALEYLKGFEFNNNLISNGVKSAKIFLVWR